MKDKNKKLDMNPNRDWNERL